MSSGRYSINTLPIPELLTAFLSLYQSTRADDRKSLLTRLKTAGEKMTSIITHQDPVVEQIDKIIISVTSEIAAAKSFLDWYELIGFLREKATLAQSLKTTIGQSITAKKNDDSLLWSTLHAMANLIVLTFTVHHNNEFFAKIQELKKDIAAKEAHKVICHETRRGKGVDEANEAIKTTLYELAMICDVTSIDRASQLFDKVTKRPLLHDFKTAESEDMQEYKCSNQAYYDAPLCLQPLFPKWLYESKYQVTTKISYEEFVKNVYEAHIAKLQKEQALASENAKQGLQPEEFDVIPSPQNNSSTQEPASSSTLTFSQELKQSSSKPIAQADTTTSVVNTTATTADEKQSNIVNVTIPSSSPSSNATPANTGIFSNSGSPKDKKNKHTKNHATGLTTEEPPSPVVQPPAVQRGKK